MLILSLLQTFFQPMRMRKGILDLVYVANAICWYPYLVLSQLYDWISNIYCQSKRLYNKESQTLYFESCESRKKITSTKNSSSMLFYFEEVVFPSKITSTAEIYTSNYKEHLNNFSYSLFFSGKEKSAANLARLSHATLALFIVISLWYLHTQCWYGKL